MVFKQGGGNVVSVGRYQILLENEISISANDVRKRRNEAF